MSKSSVSPYALCDRLSAKRHVVKKNLSFFKEALENWMEMSDEKVAEFKKLLEIDDYAVAAVNKEYFYINHRENIGKLPPVIMEIGALEYDTWVCIPWG